MVVEQPRELSTPAGWWQTREERQLGGGETEVYGDRVRVGDGERVGGRDGAGCGGIAGKIALLACR